MTLFGIDWGRSRIGTAISDRSWRMSSPFKTFTSGADAIQKVAASIREQQAERIVMGIPLSLKEHTVRSDWQGFAFYEALRKEVRLPFSWIDETMTTAQGHMYLAMSDMKYKKRRENIDRMAASLLLDSFIERNACMKKTVCVITGRIGTGKSTIARYIESAFSANRIDLDSISRTLTQKNAEGSEKIYKEFGSEFFFDGVLDRKKFGAFVFSTPAALAKLNSLLHPLIARDAREALKDSNAFLNIMEVPLYFENKLYYLGDYSLLTTAKIDVILARATKRDAVSSTYIADIVKNQVHSDDVAFLCDAVVDTTSGWEINQEKLNAFVKEIYTHYER